MNYKKIIILIGIGIFTVSAPRAQTYSERLTRAFVITNNTTIDVYNKYGKIHIHTWQADSVKFEIDYIIKANSSSRFSKLKNNISFDFTGTPYYVVAKTVISKSGGILSDLINTFLPSDNNVIINYHIHVPAYANLKLENKFGDIYSDDLKGNVNISLSNGNLKINRLTGNSVIRLTSGDGVINHIEEGRLYISYSDILIKNAGRITMESRSSRVSLEQVSYCKLQSKRDKIFINKINELYGDGYFSVYQVSQADREINYSMKYGYFTVEYINKNFSFINLNSEYTDMDLFFEKGSSYLLDITHQQDVYLNIPRRISKLEKKPMDGAEKQSFTFGKVGPAASESRVKINATRKCTINIIHK